MESPERAASEEGSEQLEATVQLAVQHEQQQQHANNTQPPCPLQQQLQALCSSLQALEATSDQVAASVQASAAATAACLHAAPGQPVTTPQDSARSTQHGGSSSSIEELQQQLAALAAEKQRIEADRQEMAVQTGEYKGTIAQLEGALAFSERKVKDQLAAMEALQAQVLGLNSELQAAKGAAAVTPERCRTAAQALQAEADRAVRNARTNEAQVKKLKQIVQLEARELSELLDFAEQERMTLLDKEAALTQELEQLRGRAVAAENGASDALAETAALEQQLGTTKEDLLSCQARVMQLEDALAEAQSALQAAHGTAEVLVSERDAVARNLLRAEAELNDVSDYSTKMFRQVRFISHVLDKNSAVLGRLPEFVNLTRDLRAFVAANARTCEPRDELRAGGLAATGGGGGGAAAAAGGVGGCDGGPALSMSTAADTTASGLRDVLGKP